jgi:tetratricopeptide (TPR) repeat protein
MTSFFSRIFRNILPILALLLSLNSCAGTDRVVPDDLNEVTFFQEAQKIAGEEGDYQLAIRYYETFIERYPDDLQRIVIAKYEIAFLNYKRGRYELARQQFEELLTYYENEGSIVLPKWPKILAEKVLEEKLK